MRKCILPSQCGAIQNSDTWADSSNSSEKGVVL